MQRVSKRSSRQESEESEQSRPRSRALEGMIGWEDLLPWQRDNEYILTGYRRASYSCRKSLATVLRIHNETVNIWTHLLGTIAFSLIPFFFYLSTAHYYSEARLSDLQALCIFFSGVTVCFAFSTSFHTFSNHSEGIWRFTSHLDHLGIVTVMWGSTIPSDHFGFYCDRRLRSFYKCLATVTALGCAVFTMGNKFRTPAYRPVRVAMYAFLGLSAFIPIAHGVMENGWELQNKRQAISYFIGLGLLNGSGAAIYAIRVPERWYPKVFDIIGSSHQIMHILVMCGALCYSVGLGKAFSHWHATGIQTGGPCTSF